jgi:hypothetical protein
VWVFPPSETTAFALYMQKHLYWQETSMAQIFNVLKLASEAVVDLALDYTEYSSMPEEHNQAGCKLWRNLRGPFRNLSTLRVHNDLIWEISNSLRSGEEPPLEILPELKALYLREAMVTRRSPHSSTNVWS